MRRCSALMGWCQADVHGKEARKVVQATVEARGELVQSEWECKCDTREFNCWLFTVSHSLVVISRCVVHVYFKDTRFKAG